MSRFSSQTWGIDSAQAVVPSPIPAFVLPNTGIPVSTATYRIWVVACGWHTQSFGMPTVSSTVGGTLGTGEAPAWTKITEGGIPSSGNARWAAWTSNALVRGDISRYNIDIPFVGDTPSAYDSAPMGHWWSGLWVNTGTGTLIPFNLNVSGFVGTDFTVPSYPTGAHWYDPIQWLVGMPAAATASPLGLMQMTYDDSGGSTFNTTSVQWRDPSNVVHCRVSGVQAYGSTSSVIGRLHTSRPSTFGTPAAGQFILLQGGWG